MIRIKRQLGFCQPYKIKLQRLSEKKNCIENLCNEIFYEIFDYLDGYDVYKAFSNLNIRLENLLISSSFFMKIEISSDTIFNSHYEQFLKSNKHHIISFEFDTQLCLDKFMNLFTINSSFSRLQSLILNEISAYESLRILFYLKSLPYLSSLSICLNNCLNNLGDIYQMIFHLSLKYFRIAVPQHPLLWINIPIINQNQFSSIEHMIMYHRCTFNQLIDILSHTPQLSYLHCFNIIEPIDYFMKSKLMIKLNNLTHLIMTLHNIKFNEFEEFLLKICFQLQLLNVKIESKDENYLDANRWERIISKNMTSLNKFIFRYYDIINDKFKIAFYHSLINRFTSSFWIDRKWFFKLLIEDNELIYSIRPYEQALIDFQEYLHMNQDWKTYCTTVELNVIGTCRYENYKPFISKINPIFNMIQITYLNIECEQITGNILIKILHALKNLNSINISNSPLCEYMDLNTREKTIFKTFLKVNKITKITLHNVHQPNEIDFIFKHFPRMQFFGLHRVQGIEVRIILQYLLSIMKNNTFFHPMIICVLSCNANYNEVEKLYKMIDSENLLQNYIIYRQYDRFYVQWK